MGVMVSFSPVVSAVPSSLVEGLLTHSALSSVGSLQGLQMDFCPVGQSEGMLAPGDVSEIP